MMMMVIEVMMKIIIEIMGVVMRVMIVITVCSFLETVPPKN